MSISHPNLRINLIDLLAVLTLVFSVFLRLFELGHVPGLNGDEAWYGLVALRLLEGDFSVLTTPSGNILNPFYILPLAFAHVFFEPSFILLRSIALVSGLILIGFSYVLSRRFLDYRAAVVVTLLIASLPINIAYSRFGWDTSQTVLASCFVVYALINHRWKLLALSLFAAILVHPSNAALLVISILYLSIFRISSDGYSPKQKSVYTGITVLVLLLLYLVINFSIYTNWLPSIPTLIDRATDPLAAGNYMLDIARLFSGTTVYRYISGAEPSMAGNAADAIIAVAMMSMLIYLLVSTFRDRKRGEFAFVAAFIITLITWYLFYSDFPLQPAQERYSLYMVMPVLVCTGFLCKKLLTTVKYEKIMIVTLVLSNLMLSGFVSNYFIHFHKTGGQSEQTFMTNIKEPKKLVFDKIMELAGGREITLLASGWWNYQPLAYLAYDADKLNVVNIIAEKNLNIRESDEVYINTFVGDDIDRLVQDRLAHKIDSGWVFSTFSGDPLMKLYKMQPMPMQFRIE